MEVRLILVRHGRTASNAGNVWQGQSDIPLDDVGRRQAERLGERLSREPSATRIVSSDLSRCVETAQPLAAAWGMDVDTDPALREVFAGTWEGLSRSQIAERWPDDLARWRAGEDLRIGGGERISDAGLRVRDCLERLVAETPDVVVVGHGGALRSAVQQMIGVGRDGRFLVTLRNAHWAVLRDGVHGWAIDSWNLS